MSGKWESWPDQEVSPFPPLSCVWDAGVRLGAPAAWTTGELEDWAGAAGQCKELTFLSIA